MTKTKRIAILAAAVLGLGIATVATELPGRDDLATAAGKTASVVEVLVKEARAALPEKPGLNVAYANRTGSGLELRTMATDRVLVLLSARGKEGDPFTIVRIEPVEKKKEIQELFAKKAKKPPGPPAGDPPRGEAGPTASEK
jgi:hypothetical protein